MLRSSNSNLEKEFDLLVEWSLSVNGVCLWEKRMKNELDRASVLQNPIRRNEEVPGYL